MPSWTGAAGGRPPSGANPWLASPGATMVSAVLVRPVGAMTSRLAWRA
jgi:hypothetical protein